MRKHVANGVLCSCSAAHARQAGAAAVPAGLVRGGLLARDLPTNRSTGSITMESRADSTLVLDRYLPDWQFREVHGRRIEAPARRVRETLMAFTPRDTPLSGLMMAMRLVPAALAARTWPLPPSRPWV